MTETPQRSYRAHLVPAGTPLDQVENLANAGGLTPLRLRATNGTSAQIHAHRVTGLPVHSVERVEGGAQ